MWSNNGCLDRVSRRKPGYNSDKRLRQYFSMPETRATTEPYTNSSRANRFDASSGACVSSGQSPANAENDPRKLLTLRASRSGRLRNGLDSFRADQAGRNRVRTSTSRAFAAGIRPWQFTSDGSHRSAATHLCETSTRPVRRALRRGIAAQAQRSGPEAHAGQLLYSFCSCHGTHHLVKVPGNQGHISRASQRT